MRAADFTTYVLQAAVFTPDGAPPAARVLKEFLGPWGDRFDGSPVVLPEADILPAEVPRVFLSSMDKAWRLEFAPVRSTLTHTGVGNLPPPESAADFFRDAAVRFDVFRERLGVRIGRVAAIVKRAAASTDPGVQLARHFCAPRWHAAPLNRPEGFELHAHKKFSAAGLPEVNSWMRIKTGAIVRDGAPQRAVVVEQDINTLAEMLGVASFDDKALLSFYGAMPNELDTVLALYFPDPGAP
jgi:hypothetical protein